jgi:hypothetical protein
MHSADLLVPLPLQAAFAHIHGTFATLKPQHLTLEPGSIFITHHEATTIYKGFSWFHLIAKFSVLDLACCIWQPGESFGDGGCFVAADEYRTRLEGEELGLERCERPVDVSEGRLHWVRDEEIRAVHYGAEMQIGVVYRAVAQFDRGA